MSFLSLRAAGAALFLVCLSPAAAAQDVTPGGPSASSVLQDRVEELERQLGQATDRADRAEHRARQADAEIARLQAMVTDLAVVRDARDELDAEEADQPPPPSPRESRAAPRTPQSRTEGTLGEIPASDVEALQRGPGIDAAALYNSATDYLNDGQYAQAQRTYGEFISQFSSDPNVAEARYWRAFALLAVRSNNEAALGFSEYLQRHPSGRRAPDSYVRLGMALKAQNLTQEACGAFAEFRRRYPRAHQALRDLATRESRGLTCPR